MRHGKDRPNIHPLVHPPLLALIHLAAACLLGWIFTLPPGVPNPVRNAGFALSITGFIFGAVAVLEFRKAHTTLDPHGSVSRLVTQGIYRFSRNPIYLGYLLMVIGFPLFSGSCWGLLMAPLYAASMNRLVIQKEEAYLEDKFQEQYAVYRFRVRRWL